MRAGGRAERVRLMIAIVATIGLVTVGGGITPAFGAVPAGAALTASARLSAGRASVTLPKLGAGRDGLAVSYPGSATVSESSATVRMTVTR